MNFGTPVMNTSSHQLSSSTTVITSILNGAEGKNRVTHPPALNLKYDYGSALSLALGILGVTDLALG